MIGTTTFKLAVFIYIIVSSKQLHFYLQNIEEEKSKQVKDDNCMVDVVEAVKEIFSNSIQAAYPNIPDPMVAVTTSQQQRFGDYQCNSAMAISQVISLWLSGLEQNEEFCELYFRKMEWFAFIFNFPPQKKRIIN